MRERGALHIFHDQVHHVPSNLAIVDGNNGRVGQRRSHARFVQTGHVRQVAALQRIGQGILFARRKQINGSVARFKRIQRIYLGIAIHVVAHPASPLRVKLGEFDFLDGHQALHQHIFADKDRAEAARADFFKGQIFIQDESRIVHACPFRLLSAPCVFGSLRFFAF